MDKPKFTSSSIDPNEDNDSEVRDIRKNFEVFKKKSMKDDHLYDGKKPKPSFDSKDLDDISTSEEKETPAFETKDLNITEDNNMPGFKTKKISSGSKPRGSKSTTRKKKGTWKDKIKDWRFWLKWGGITSVSGVLIGGIVVASVFLYYARELPSIDELESIEKADQSTKIYDQSGKNILYEVHGEENRTLISFEDIPEACRDGIVAAEDDEFYKHKGVDLKGFLSGVILNPLRGRSARGGSTLTQQLIKNTLLTNEKTVSRKVKEAILAVELERKYSKDKILELYLNRVPYGNNAYGLQAAAQTYFNKDAKDLNLAECSILVGLPNRPTILNPYGSHQDQLFARQEYTLNQMEKFDKISTEEKDEAIKLAQEEGFFQSIERHTTIKAPHFVFYVQELLEEWAEDNDIDPITLQTDGYKVITTLDYELQEKAEAVVKEYGDKNEDYQIQNMAMTALEPGTGRIIAMVGSRDWFRDDIDGKVNVNLSKRQPGSSFKPYEYATAYKKGYTPNTILYDVRTNFGSDGSGGSYIPNNFDYKFKGPISMKNALIQSRNIPAIKTFYLAGAKDVINTARGMGLTNLDPKKNYGLSTALGTEEVKLLDHLAALSSFGSEGLKVDDFAILQIINGGGEVVLDNTGKKSKERALDANVANMMNYSLTRTSGSLVVPGHKVASKTGTSTKVVEGKSYPSNTWTFGWTNELSAGFWAGNNDGSKLSPKAVSTRNAGPAFVAFMTEALKKYPKSSFTEPKIEKTGKVILDGGNLDDAVETVKVCKYEGKLATENTPASQIEEQTFGGAHSILYYVNRKDPKGDRPSSPEDDNQFVNWEKGVLAYSQGKSLDEVTDIRTESSPPDEFCSVHDNENNPVIQIITPEEDSTLDEHIFTIEVNAETPLTEEYDDINIKQVEFYVNGEKFGTKTSPSDGEYMYEYEIDAIGIYGETKIAIKVFDTIDNMIMYEFTVSLPDEEPVEPPPATEEEVCTDAGYTWFEFPNGCVDSCDFARDPSIVCTDEMTYGCDCGVDQCWNGTSCEDN